MSNEEILAIKIENYLKSERNEPLLLNTDELILCMLALRIQVIYKTSDCVSDDVCEWKQGKVNDEWQPSCEPNSAFNVFGVAWFKKCPYCGKKIKVVEE